MNEADAVLIADVIGAVVSLEDSLNEVKILRCQIFVYLNLSPDKHGKILNQK